LLLVFVGIPLAMPVIELFGNVDSVLSNQNSPLSISTARRLFLYQNTFLLIGGTLAASLPVGIAAAVLLYRTDLPCRRPLRFLIILMLFVPLPVLTTAWQTALGQAGVWTASGGRWAEGLPPSIWVHALAGLPWVILIVGQGLRSVEPELEEDALLAARPWRVLWRVTLPRCRGAIAAAGIWVTLQASGEIAVTDLMRVDTVAREIYNEFTLGSADALARAVAVSLPLIVVGGAALYWALIRLERVLPPLASPLAEPRPFHLGRARWVWLTIVLACFGLLAGVPLMSLVWRTGLVGYPPEWSGSALAGQLTGTMHAEAALIWKSILTMFLSAALIAMVALILCWLALDAPRYRHLVFALMALAWVIPGPIIGLGLKETIMNLVQRDIPRPLLVALHYGPSPLPVLWAQLLHFLPCAVFALWPAVRLLPPELRDSLRLDTARAGQELRHLVWPLLRRSWLAVVVVIAALALGEVGAVAMRVETPDWTMFAHELFNRMHFGQPPDVTALCLVLLLMIGAGGVIAVFLIRLTRSEPRS
jgi:iron(III) transport system permease protein